MKPWENLWNRITWSYPWWVLVAGYVGLLVGAVVITWLISRRRFKRSIVDFMDENAQLEIMSRNLKIADLERRLNRETAREGLMATAIKVAQEALAGGVFIGQ